MMCRDIEVMARDIKCSGGRRGGGGGVEMR